MSDIDIPPERRIKIIERPDGRGRLLIFSPQNGVYQFGIETDWEDEGQAWKLVSDLSGLFGSAEEAEQAARLEVFWLRDQSAKTGH